jgi:hypothetical protein
MRRIASGRSWAVLAAVAFALSTATGAATAQSASYAKEVQGTWTLVSQYGEVDGKRIDTFGSNPRGMMVLTPDGRFTIVLLKSSLPAFASNNRNKGTPEENQAVVQGSVAYFGTYSILSEADKTVSLRIQGSTFPNWDGQEQKRVMTVTGDVMNLTNPSAAIGGTSYVTWKRAK